LALDLSGDNRLAQRAFPPLRVSDGVAAPADLCELRGSVRD